MIEGDGTHRTQTLPHCYRHPADYLPHRKTLAEVRELAQNNKIRDFKGWGLTDKRRVDLAGKPGYFYTLMLSVPEYDKLAEQQHLLGRYKLRQREAERTGGSVIRPDEPGDVEPGIYLSARGMPTGIVLPFPTGTTRLDIGITSIFWSKLNGSASMRVARSCRVARKKLSRGPAKAFGMRCARGTRFAVHESENSVDQFAENDKVQAHSI